MILYEPNMTFGHWLCLMAIATQSSVLKVANFGKIYNFECRLLWDISEFKEHSFFHLW